MKSSFRTSLQLEFRDSLTRSERNKCGKIATKSKPIGPFAALNQMHPEGLSKNKSRTNAHLQLYHFRP